MFRFFQSRLIITILVGLILCSNQTVFALPEQDAPVDFCTYLDRRIPKLMDKYEIPGVNISIIENGKLEWSKAYGYADIESGRRMEIDTICRTESISKSVTAWGVLKLVEKGALELDKPVIAYIKNWSFPPSAFSEKEITVRQLLSQSSGMPLGTIGEEYSPGEDMPSLEEYLAKEAKLIHEPGEAFLYSNVGYNLLELLIEEVTDRDFAEYMENEVLKPLGMNDSYFTWNERVKSELPLGYDLNGQPVSPYIYPAKSSGGLYATVEDVARFALAGMTAQNLTKNHVLEPASIRELYTPTTKMTGPYTFVSNSYGFGHFIEKFPNGEKAVFHGGQGHGWMTHFHSIPEKGEGIVVVTNSQRSWPFISYILSDWAKWNGMSSIGMGKIAQGIKIIWTLICIFFFISLILLFRFVGGLLFGNRRFKPLSKESRAIRVMQFSVSIALLAILMWCMNQDYLFITSVFPTAYQWLGLSILIFSVSLFLSALVPYTGIDRAQPAKR